MPETFTRQELIDAIKRIDANPEIKIGRHSSTYDLVYNGKKYPPILVLSVASELKHGKELTLNDFGNNIEIPFKILRDNDFVISRKQDHENLNNKIWIEKTIVKGRKDRLLGDRSLGKALWSPQKDKRGADIYKNMRLVKKGDIILHLIDNKEFCGLSIVDHEVVDAEGVQGTDWDGPAYLIRLVNYEELIPRINREELLNQKSRKILSQVSSDSEVFYTTDLALRQGAYLTPCTKELIQLINAIFKQKSGKNLPHINMSEDVYVDLDSNKEFNIQKFRTDLLNSGLLYSQILTSRFISSLITKPFVILTGLSGSGKTKLAQAFVQWICQDDSQYTIVPVGADWTNREPLLGYPNALNPKDYVKPDSGVLDLIISANSHTHLPHFLILDEMNLSHVERYFADFLSVMESKETIPLYSGGSVDNGVPAKLTLPSNLFVIGTVNIDETTNMFSPKVLDRANTIEFRISEKEIGDYFESSKALDMDQLLGKGSNMASSFLQLANNKSFAKENTKEINSTLINFFKELQKTGAEFGYRSASEIHRLINQLTVLDQELSRDEKIDIAIMQKLLPKLHGSRRKLCPILETLASFCIEGEISLEKDIVGNEAFSFENTDVKYPLSLEKITRMYKGALDNGFTSFAEA